MNHTILIRLFVLLSLSLAWAQPGSVVDAQLLRTHSTANLDALSDSGVPATRYAVEEYRIRYRSTALDGSSVTVNALMFLPILPEPEAVPIYVFGSGSTGLRDSCAPSLEHQLGIRWGNYRGHTAARAGHGLITIMPDYMGFGVQGMFQPYYSKEAEGRVMLDAVRAVQNFFTTVDFNVTLADAAFVAGYSQGGHAAFSAADLNADYAPDVPLRGVLGYGPSADVFTLFRDWSVAAPLAVYTYSQIYGRERFNPADILPANLVNSLERDVTTRCIGGIQSFYPRGRNLYVAAFADALYGGTLQRDFPSIFEILSENTAGLSGHGLPALVQQGTEDTVVRLSSQNSYVERLCAGGSRVAYPNFVGSGHDTRVPGFRGALEWIQTVASGDTPPSDCG